jgi:hypothetical protein
MNQALKMEAEITFFSKKVIVKCDGNCQKAWGAHTRPRQSLSHVPGTFENHPEDWEYLADYELKDAPLDPGTYEGGHGKPLSPLDFPNKWCVRECERSGISEPGDPLVMPDFSKRIANPQYDSGETELNLWELVAIIWKNTDELLKMALGKNELWHKHSLSRKKPDIGDLVMEISSTHRLRNETAQNIFRAVGFLRERDGNNYIIETLDGSLRKWTNCEFIKVLLPEED